jgi:hypothetical protein
MLSLEKTLAEARAALELLRKDTEQMSLKNEALIADLSGQVLLCQYISYTHLALETSPILAHALILNKPAQGHVLYHSFVHSYALKKANWPT